MLDYKVFVIFLIECPLCKPPNPALDGTLSFNPFWTILKQKIKALNTNFPRLRLGFLSRKLNSINTINSIV